YNARLPGVLTLVDSYSDGWHAQVNGREAPVIRVDGVFRGVRIETPGEVEVRFWYRPPRWNLSLALCGLGLLLLSVSALASQRRRIGLTSRLQTCCKESKARKDPREGGITNGPA